MWHLFLNPFYCAYASVVTADIIGDNYTFDSTSMDVDPAVNEAHWVGNGSYPSKLQLIAI